MSWELLSQIAQVLEGVAVIFILIFGVVQLRQYKQQRNDTASVELMRSLQDVEFIHAFQLINALPDGLTADEIKARGSDYEKAAFVLSARFEIIGQIVSRNSIPSEIVEELVGGGVITLWRKLKRWTVDLRDEQDYPYLWEWFQWLAEQFEKNGRAEIPPAYMKAE